MALLAGPQTHIVVVVVVVVVAVVVAAVVVVSLANEWLIVNTPVCMCATNFIDDAHMSLMLQLSPKHPRQSRHAHCKVCFN